MMLMKYYKNSYAWYWKKGIFTPLNIVCHKVDRYMMDAVNRSQIHPQGGGLLRCWNCALTSISCQIWSQSIYRITGIIFVVSCEKLILLVRLFIKRYVICKRIIYIYTSHVWFIVFCQPLCSLLPYVQTYQVVCKECS